MSIVVRLSAVVLAAVMIMGCASQGDRVRQSTGDPTATTGPVVTTGATDAAPVGDRHTAPSASCADVRAAASRQPGFAYAERVAPRVLRIGLVGWPSAAFDEHVRQARRACTVRLVRAMHTRTQLRAAVDQVVATRLEGGVSARVLPRARGIEVSTSDPGLLSTRDPSRYLGLRVGVVVEHSVITPA